MLNEKREKETKLTNDPSVHDIQWKIFACYLKEIEYEWLRNWLYQKTSNQDAV